MISIRYWGALTVNGVNYYSSSDTDRALEAIARVRKLHLCCDDCCDSCHTCCESYPCETIKALDGEQ